MKLNRNILLSILCGIGIIVILKKSCYNNECSIYKSPHNFDTEIKDGKKCYKLIKYNSKCFY